MEVEPIDAKLVHVELGQADHDGGEDQQRDVAADDCAFREFMARKGGIVHLAYLMR
jgi:hypothetical protein